MNYECAYGIRTLDDLHNFFPEILYNHERFTTVEELLHYFNTMIRTRFNTYTFNRNRYTGRATNPSGYRDSYISSVPMSWNIVEEYHEEYSPPINRGISFPTESRPPVSRANTATQSILTAVQSVMQPPSTQPSSTATVPDTFRHLISHIIHSSTQLNPRNVPTDTRQRMRNLVNLASDTEIDETSARRFMDPVRVIPNANVIRNATRIETLPVGENTMCTICQENIAAGRTMRRILFCGHVFHDGCIDTWFRGNVRCPICRHDIRDYDTSDVPSPTLSDVERTIIPPGLPHAEDSDDGDGEGWHAAHGESDVTIDIPMDTSP